ncbi:hypothetical protein ACJX0J_010693 [Zea mays]
MSQCLDVILPFVAFFLHTHHQGIPVDLIQLQHVQPNQKITKTLIDYNLEYTYISPFPTWLSRPKIKFAARKKTMAVSTNTLQFKTKKISLFHTWDILTISGTSTHKKA